MAPLAWYEVLLSRPRPRPLLLVRVLDTSLNFVSAYRRNINPRTGVLNSEGRSPVLAHNLSAAAHNRFSMSFPLDDATAFFLLVKVLCLTDSFVRSVFSGNGEYLNLFRLVVKILPEDTINNCLLLQTTRIQIEFNANMS